MAQTMDDFRAIYRSHHGFVWHALHRFGLQPASLEDAVQDVFIVAYRRRDGFSGSSRKAWLYGIARRVASNYRRAGQRRARRSEAYGSAVSAPRQPVPEAIVALDQFLARLPQQDRELFVLSEVEGLSGPEIAAARGHNLNTVYTRIRKLRRGLGAEVPDAQRVRKEQPRASAGSWGLLAPWLEGASAVGATAAGATGLAKWGFGLALVSTVAVGAAVVARPSLSPPTPASARPRTETPEADVAQARPVVEAPSASVAAPVAVAPEVVEQEEPVPHDGQTTPSNRAARRRAAAVEAEPSTSDRLAEENAMLRGASAALTAGRAQDALRQTSEHQRRFPKSSFADLRAAIRIEALCAVGKARQAQAEGKLLIEERPQSAAARRVRSALKKNCDASPQNPVGPDTTEP